MSTDELETGSGGVRVTRSRRCCGQCARSAACALVPGISFAVAVAAVATLLGRLAPVVGAPVFAVLAGIAVVIVGLTSLGLRALTGTFDAARPAWPPSRTTMAPGRKPAEGQINRRCAADSSQPDWTTIMCTHDPVCPAADAIDWWAAHNIAEHPSQGWTLLCNGAFVFDDHGALLPDGRVAAISDTPRTWLCPAT